jgi:hypothetical protein
VRLLVDEMHGLAGRSDLDVFIAAVAADYVLRLGAGDHRR